MRKEQQDFDNLLGRWLVFKHYDELDSTWEVIREAMCEDELQGCILISCSTMKYNPKESGPGPRTTGLIRVHTEEHNMDDIGFKLIQLVKQDIKYKRFCNTLEGKYTHAVSGRTTIKTIYWNSGRP